jgi:four helix bundle protein
MTPVELRSRIADFAAAVARHVKPLFSRPDTVNAASQLQRSSASAMANHRSAGRARTHAEFTSKLNVAVEEIDEAQGWLKYLEDAAEVGPADRDEHARLYAEATELTAILTASLTTARKKEQAARTHQQRPPRR